MVVTQHRLSGWFIQLFIALSMFSFTATGLINQSNITTRSTRDVRATSNYPASDSSTITPSFEHTSEAGLGSSPFIVAASVPSHSMSSSWSKYSKIIQQIVERPTGLNGKSSNSCCNGRIYGGRLSAQSIGLPFASALVAAADTYYDSSAYSYLSNTADMSNEGNVQRVMAVLDGNIKQVLQIKYPQSQQKPTSYLIFSLFLSW